MLKLKFLSKKLKEKKTSASKFKEKSLYFMKKSFFPFYNNIPIYYSIFCRISAKILIYLFGCWNLLLKPANYLNIEVLFNSLIRIFQ